MKKIFFALAPRWPFAALALFTGLPFAARAQDSFTVNLNVGRENAPAKAYILYLKNQKPHVDSALLTNGEGRFTGSLEAPALARLIIDHKGEGFGKQNQESDMRMVYLEKGAMTIRTKDSLKNATITGSPLNKEYMRYTAVLAVPMKQSAQMNKEYQALSPADRKQQMQRFIERGTTIRAEQRMLERQFIKDNPGSYFSLVALRDVAGEIFDKDTIEPVFTTLSARVRESRDGKEFVEQMAKMEITAVGKMAPEFTQNDVNDNPVSLRDFRGKYVLVDFWASWCHPCRQENPNVVKAYNNYKDKDFTVLSVSLDRPGKKDDWVAAIKEDGLTWTQVSDLKFWDNEVAKKYGIRSVPQNFLIDPNGKIIAKNLRGDDLQDKLKELFKSQAI